MEYVKGNRIKFSLDGELVASATSCEVELSQTLEEYQPIPGSTEDDGWAHFRAGELSWGVSADGLATFGNVSWLLDEVVSNDVGLSASVNINNASTILGGTVHVSEYAITADVRGLSKFSCKMVCDAWPSMTY